MHSSPGPPQPAHLLYPDTSAIAYQPVPASQLIASNRYGQYHIGSSNPLSTTTTSGPLQPLTHLPSQTSPLHYVASQPQSFQPRGLQYGRVLPPFQVASAPVQATYIAQPGQLYTQQPIQPVNMPAPPIYTTHDSFPSPQSQQPPIQTPQNARHQWNTPNFP